jgi:quinol monooxygenase YgiN/lysophospholipase L1-like esterase
VTLAVAFLSAAAYGAAMPVTGDSLVLVQTTPGNLCYDQVVPGSLTLRSKYDPAQEGCVTYEEGRDYTVDWQHGAIARTADSRIPDFSTNMLYNQKDFDHTKFPGFGNQAFFVYADYQTLNGFPLAAESSQAERLARTRAKLEAGGPFKIIVFGDSISAGGDASELRLRFDQRYAEHLRTQFPKAEITVENGATGGDATPGGLARLDEKVLSRAPDLVLMGFGMNDHNINGVPPDQFEANLVAMINQIHEKTGAEVLLFSALLPNPDWKFGSHRMELYPPATRRAADATQSAYADVYGVWQKVLERKDLSSLLGNNINHPNDFGHGLYYLALAAVKFQEDPAQGANNMVFVVATIELNPGIREAFLGIFNANVPNVLAEDGCLGYEPTIDVASGIPAQEAPRDNVVVIVEKWASLEHLRTHLTAPHMGVYREKVKDLVKKVNLQVLTSALEK